MDSGLEESRNRFTRGFLSTDITVADMIEQRGDIHHLFPYDFGKDYAANRAAQTERREQEEPAY